jgi:hypothetical protein
MSTEVNDFDAAKTISDLLKDMEKERQERVLRWVAESLSIKLHLRHEAPLTATASGANPLVGPAPMGRTTDIKSFVDAKKPKSDNQFAAVVAYYYRFEASPDERHESITAEILQNAARLAGHARLAKPLKTLNNAKRLGYLDSAERGAFRINSVGENLVAMTLPGSDKAVKAHSKRQTKPRKTTTKRR